MIDQFTDNSTENPKPFSLAKPRLSDAQCYLELTDMVQKFRLKNEELIAQLDPENPHIEAIKQIAKITWKDLPLEDDDMFPYVRYTKLSTRRKRAQNLFGTATIPDLIASYNLHFESMNDYSRPAANESLEIWMDCKLPAFTMNEILLASGLRSRVFSIPFLREIAHPIVGVKIDLHQTLYINFYQRSVEFIDSNMPHAKLQDEIMGSRVFPRAENGLILADLIMLATEASSYLVYVNLTIEEKQICLSRLIYSTEALRFNFGENNYYYHYFSNILNRFK